MTSHGRAADNVTPLDPSDLLDAMEAALRSERHERRLTSVVLRCIACQVEERLYRRLLPRLLEAVAKEKILVHRETRPLGLSAVSFSSAVPEWESALAEWILDLIGPTLDTIFTRKRRN